MICTETIDTLVRKSNPEGGIEVETSEEQALPIDCSCELKTVQRGDGSWESRFIVTRNQVQVTSEEG